MEHVEPESIKFMARCVAFASVVASLSLTFRWSRSYLEEYIDIFATSENVSYLYHLALKVKTVRDKQSHTFDKVGFALSLSCSCSSSTT